MSQRLKCLRSKDWFSPKKEDECVEFTFVPEDLPEPKLHTFRLEEGQLTLWGRKGDFVVGNYYNLDRLAVIKNADSI